ncbi:unnamed protein product [Rotaria sordida]|uniref:Uncharacterized protein n=1 Tax=Rotaria sordida TaxID=392033 RepID=A0A815B7M3_9BILA|nr:unnamed protein product [Rotaria sordida]CAF1271795.1 unnamed protein product [Rotaria sordida]CAF1546433.1 unnamed protein product [Rotaria sordida]CAF1551338.1 unnamed protein product [Rotaria sordida]
MDVTILPEDENNPNAEETSSMTANVGSGNEINNRSYSSPSAYNDELGGRINRTTSSDNSNFQIDSSMSAYDPNTLVGRQLHDLTYTIKQLITSVSSLNQNINQLHGDMVKIASGMGDLRNDVRCLKDDFNNRNVTNGGAGGDS